MPTSGGMLLQLWLLCVGAQSEPGWESGVEFSLEIGLSEFD